MEQRRQETGARLRNAAPSARHQELQRQLREAKARDSSPEEKAAARAAAILVVIKGSDDFELHRDVFLKASHEFLKAGGTLAGLREIGGWVRSPHYTPRLVYFTYGVPHGMAKDRYYYDVETGELFR